MNLFSDVFQPIISSPLFLIAAAVVFCFSLVRSLADFLLSKKIKSLSKKGRSRQEIYEDFKSRTALPWEITFLTWVMYQNSDRYNVERFIYRFTRLTLDSEEAKRSTS